MVETKYDKSHHAGPDAASRIAARLRNSGDPSADHVIHKGGDAPGRTYTNIHDAGHKIQPGTLPDKDAGR
jgi:hypothetical protein